MPRAVVTVRDARPQDLPVLLQMWADLRELGGRADRTTPPATPDGALARLAQVADDPHCRIVVAVLDDEVAGMAVLTHQPFAPLHDIRSVHLHFLHVQPGRRRRGVGRALVAAATTYAEEMQAEHVVTSVYPQLREANRFYARLGFTPVVVRRVATVAALRRRLAVEGQGATGEVVARRRMRRLRTAVTRSADRPVEPATRPFPPSGVPLGSRPVGDSVRSVTPDLRRTVDEGAAGS